MNILVTGAGGQLGSELSFLSTSDKSNNWVLCNSAQLDISNGSSFEQLCTDKNIELVINCAAYTKVDLAEKELEKAMNINANALQSIATICKRKCIKLIHISSDYVYHHNPGRLLLETDETNPKSIYGKSKLKGEQLIDEHLDDYIIIRTSWVYSSFGGNFVRTMLRLSQTKEELSIVADQIGTPTYARDLAEVIIIIISLINDKGIEGFEGVYNFSNFGVSNWAEFAEEIFLIKKAKIKINPVTTLDYGAAAPRPNWSMMDKSKIVSTFGIELKSWKESLRKCLSIIEDS